MGAHADAVWEQAMKDALDGPTVGAAPGYFSLYAKWPDQDPEPVLAWKVGADVVLPVTRHGCVITRNTLHDKSWVLYPDGIVRYHGLNLGSVVPNFASLAEWLAKFKSDLVSWIASDPDYVPF